MALVDPSIAMSYRAPEFKAPNQLAQYAQMQQILGGQQEQQLNALKMQEYERARIENEGLSNYLAQADLTNPQTRIGALKYGKRGAEFGKALSEQEKDVAATASSAATTQKTNIDNSRSLLVGVNDQPAYDAWRTYSVSKIPELANILPAQFTPEVKDSLLRTADDISKRLTAAPTFQSGAAGSTILKDGVPIYTVPEKTPTQPAPPASVAEYERAQKDPNFMMFLQQRAAAMRPVTTVQLPPQEKAEQAERGKMLTSEYSDISKAAKLAAKTLPSIDANLNVLNSGFKTGFGTETVAAGAKVLAALGVDNAEKFAQNAQIFQAKAAEAVLQKQLEQKGPQTQSDRELIEKTGAQLGTTTQGNKFLLTVAKEQLKREMEQRNFYDSWWKNNKTYDGAESAWYAGEGGKSLFDRSALKAYAAPSAALQIPTTAAPVASAIPQRAIDALKAGRGTDAQFDEMFGLGAAKRARGGK